MEKNVRRRSIKKISHCVLLDPRPESTESVYEDDEDVGGGEDLKNKVIVYKSCSELFILKVS